ncbi:MAG: DUF2334 domain-containing protein [Lachnospiraceae bacterium]|nr:DUF2334 domain-containing protein [Lachnospiraceae bacterium]
MRLAVRLDDIAPAMCWDRFERMTALLDRYQAKPLLGVIPDCTDEKLLNGEGVTTVPAEEFAGRIREFRSQGAEVAMHGVHHVYTTQDGGIFPLNRKSEFAGLPYEEQEKLLQEGVRRMEELGLATDIFMAPSHSYDENTLKALKACGFRRVTDGFGSDPYRYRELTFYPITRSQKQAVQSKTEGTATLVYHVNSMTEEDFARVEALFSEARLIAYKTLLFEPTVRRSDFGQRVERLTAQAKRFLVEKGSKGKGKEKGA